MDINFTPRNYQEQITLTAKSNNTLVVLPTGTGKTAIALMTAIERLKEKNNTNILVLTPTKPLSAQIHREFIEKTKIPKEKVVLLTGEISPKKRKELWEDCIVAIATPQTIQKDLENDRISLSVTSLLVIDECHRSRENFANTIVSQIYMKQAKYPRTLALTASPGGTKEKIEEIKKNLFIEQVEIRTEEDIKEYIQERNINWLEVELPRELKQILDLIKKPYLRKLKEIRKFGVTKPINLITKKDLLILQNRLRVNPKKDRSSFYGIYLTALLIKLDYLSELLETQGIFSLDEFIKKLKKEETKAAKTIINIPEIKKVLVKIEELKEKNTKHPKIYMLKGIVRKELEKKNNSKIIVFANYINTIQEILEELTTIKKVNAIRLVGQKSGLKQKDQIKTIKDFEDGKYNVLVASSIGEEGIDIKGATMAIMFDQGTSSEIRKIQRYGRVARLEEGRIICLLTRNTREMGYYWASLKKEKTMRSTLKKMQDLSLKEFQK